MQFRQGDVFVESVGEIPPGAEPVAADGGRLILAYGEATGHAHAVTAAPGVRLLTVPGLDDRFLEVGGDGAEVRHEEHAPIPLPPGLYRVRRQREYRPEELPRYVSD